MKELNHEEELQTAGGATSWYNLSFTPKVYEGGTWVNSFPYMVPSHELSRPSRGQSQIAAGEQAPIRYIFTVPTEWRWSAVRWNPTGSRTAMSSQPYSENSVYPLRAGVRSFFVLQTDCDDFFARGQINRCSAPPSFSRCMTEA